MEGLKFVVPKSVVKLLDLKKQFAPLRKEMIKVAAEVIDSGWYLLGNRTDVFEADFAKWLGSNHAASCANGTDALTLALWAMGIGDGDEVITVPNTAFPTACSISRCGARPVFVDIDPQTWLIDIEQVAAAVTARTKAVIPVHLYGQVVDIPKLRSLLPEQVRILEDCAQAHGATLHGCKVGNMGDIASFSFYPSKNLGALGDGGLVVTDDIRLDTAVRQLRFYGQKSRDLHVHTGMNSRLDEIQAAFLSLELDYLDEWLALRRGNAERYGKSLVSKGFVFPQSVEGSDPAYHLFVMQVPDRSHFQEYLAGRGVQTGVHYPVPIPFQPAYSYLGHKHGDFPHAEALAEKIVSLPIAPHLTDQDSDHVITACLEYSRR